MRARTVNVEKLKEMHERGLSQTTIGRLLKIHRTSVGYYLDILGIRRTTVRNYKAWLARVERARSYEAIQRRRMKEADEIVRLYTEEKLRVAEISRQMHIDRRQIHRTLSSRTISIQPRARKETPPKIKAEKKTRPPVQELESPEMVEKLLSPASARKARSAA